MNKIVKFKKNIAIGDGHNSLLQILSAKINYELNVDKKIKNYEIENILVVKGLENFKIKTAEIKKFIAETKSKIENYDAIMKKFFK